MPIESRPSASTVDLEDLLQTGEPIVLAVDQVPFDVESRGVKNTFCLLVPLLTESGHELDLRQFRNRERVWWMLRPDLEPAQIRVGMVWSAPIERSREHQSRDPEKDHYQARRTDIRPGARHLAEVLNLKVAHPDLSELLDPAGIPWPYPTLQRVVVRGGSSVLGPFRTSYDFERQRLHLQALTPGNPVVHRLSRKVFEEETNVRECPFTANQWDSKARQTPVELYFVNDNELSVFDRDGEKLDAATDAQVVNWALELLEVPKKDRQVFKEIFQRAGDLRSRVEAQEFPQRVERFQRLCENRGRVIELGSQVAEAVSQREGFRELVDRHIDTITSQRVQKAVDERRAQIEATTAEAEGRLARLNDRIADLQNEYAQRLEQWEKEFQDRNADRVERLEAREAALERQEKEMTERLEALVAMYREEAKTFGDQLVAQIPMLQRLGVLGPSGAGAAGVPLPRPAALELPAFLRETRARTAIGEESFLEQFESLVARRGFVFDHEDLVNFHILVKSSLWTVLAGASGLGKSSLPRLYAEALGCAEEFLMIAVRPDWLDDRDVVGAFNSFTGHYEPASCGLVDRLITADRDFATGRGGIYIVCLDEMNLARVEHYFAQFLSLLERTPEERFLQLYAQGLGDPQDPYAPHRRLRMGQNLRFVGTVNVDETTHFFSPKVIDRAPIATFERPNLRLGLEGNQASRPPGRVDPVHLEDFLSWIRPPDQRGEAVDLVLSLDEILRRFRLGLGFRVRDRILRYVSSARQLLGEDRALDLALLQNAVPALRSTAPRYQDLLRELQQLLVPGRFRRTSQALQTLAEDPESDYFQLL
jgi:hypothetical protein